MKRLALHGLSLVVFAAYAPAVPPIHAAECSPQTARAEVHFRTELFGKKYSLDDPASLAAYAKALESEIERSKREETAGDAYQKDPVHNKLPQNYVDKKVRRTLEEAHVIAVELSKESLSDATRAGELSDLFIIAESIRASFMRVLPPDMDVLEAARKERALRHPKVGLGKEGVATNLAGATTDPSTADPVSPSTFWTRPDDIGGKDLYYGFGRTSIPSLDGVVCTYRRSKQSLGTHGGFDVKCDKYGKAKLKFAEEFSQPVAHRLFWALGFNVPPVDSTPVVKVKWDRRIFTEYNTRKDEAVTVHLFGFIPVAGEHLQPYLDPLQAVSEIIMLDEQGKQITLKPDPKWRELKKKLYKNPRGRPELVAGNFNDAFADRIQYLVFRNVNLRLRDDEDVDSGETLLGNWDWSTPGLQTEREFRAFAFVSAWVNQFDSWSHNNKLSMTEKDGRRTFKHTVSDLGGCLGPADDATKMRPDVPNKFPWSFTRPARAGETAIPLNGTFVNIRDTRALRAADIHDAKWMARYIAQLTGKQILDALIGSGMPSAKVRLYYDKLVHRRNQALSDLGLDYPPLKPLDAGEEFDYDPQKDGLISTVTSRNETITAPDGGWVVVNGRAYTREQVESRLAAREITRLEKEKKGSEK